MTPPNGFDPNKKIKLSIPPQVEAHTDYPLLVNLTANNRPDVVDDDFTGTDGDAPNELLWGETIYGETDTQGAENYSIQSNTLDFALTQYEDYEGLPSKFLISGDFDIQVDFSIDSLPVGDAWTVGLVVQSDISVLLGSTPDFALMARYGASIGPYLANVKGETATTGGGSDLTGKFRITRSGSTCVMYYWNGSGWTTFKTVLSYTTNNVHIILMTRVWADDKNLNCNFDNFTVNSGTIIWPDTVLKGSGVTNLDASPIFTELGGNSKKIAIEDQATGNQCFTEIENWDHTNKSAQLHTRVPSLSTTEHTILNLYYDSTADDNDIIQPPLSIDDDFTGTDGFAPNIDLWYVNNDSASGTAQISSNKLRIMVPSTAADESIIVVSRYGVSGDFDIQVGYDEISNDVPSASGSYPVRLLITLASGTIVSIGVQYLSSGSETMWFISTADDSGTCIPHYSSGKLRIRRLSGVLTCWYWTGSQWEWNGNTSGKIFATSDTSNISMIQLETHGDTDSGATTDFDNFQLNSGTILPRLEDDFTGNDGDAPRSDLWSKDFQDGVAEILSNRLNMAISSAISSDYLWIDHEVQGDVDVQVDFDVTGTPASSIWLARLHITTDRSSADTIFYIDRRYNSTGQYVGGIKTSGVEDAGATLGTSDMTGKFRLTRVGTVVTCYYWNGTGWTSLASFASWNTDTIFIGFRLATTTAITVDVDFDNFVINSADSITGFIGDTGSVPAKTVYPDTYKFLTHNAQDPSGTAPQMLDSTQHAKHGTSYGSMTSGDLIDGLTGKAIDYDGVDDYTNHGYDAAHDITDKLTIRAVIKPGITIESGCPILGIVSRVHDPVDSASTYLLYINSTGVLGFSCAGSIMSTKDTWPAGETFVLHGTYDYNSGAQIGDVFIDGEKEILSYEGRGTMAGTTNNLVIGKNADTGQFFPGAINEVVIINAVMSDEAIAFDNLSLRDQLITYSLPVAGAALRAITDMLYGDLVGQNRIYQDMLYSILFPLRQSVDMLYGLRLQAFSTMHYGDCPTPRAITDMYFGDCPLLRQVQDMKYGDLRIIRNHVDMHYVIPKEMRAILEMRYGINGDEVRAFVDMGYDIMDVNLLRQVVDMPYVLQAGNLLQTIETTVTIGGRKVKCSHINVEASLDERFISAEIHLPDVADYVPIMREESFVVIDTLDGVSQEVHLKVENKRISRPAPGQRVYIVTALSKIMTLSAPWSRPLEADPVPGQVVDVVDTMLEDVGPVDWQTVTFPVLPDTLYGVGEDRVTVIKKLTGSVGAKIQSNPDGSVRVIQEYQISPPAWATAVPDYSLTARDFVSQDDTPVHNPGHNKFLVGSAQENDGSTWTEQEDVSDSEVKVMGFQVPWGYVDILGITHTGGDHVPVPEYQGVVEVIWPPETEAPERVTFEGGYASASRPVYTKKLDGTNVAMQVEWQDDSLGAVSANEDGSLTAEIMDGVSEGHGLADIRYLTRYHLWLVHNSVDEDVQYILWQAEE